MELPLTYFGGPGVFNLKSDEHAFALKWSKRHNIPILYPGRPPMPDTAEGIYNRCMDDMVVCQAGIFDLTPFRGAYPDIGTCAEVGALALWNKIRPQSKKLMLVTAPRAPTPQDYGGMATTMLGDKEVWVDKDDCFIDTDPWNLMIYRAIKESGGEFFFGPREQAYDAMAEYIKRWAGS